MGIQPNHEVLPVILHGSIGERFVTLVVIHFLHLMKLNCRCVQLQSTPPKEKGFHVM